MTLYGRWGLVTQERALRMARAGRTPDEIATTLRKPLDAVEELLEDGSPDPREVDEPYRCPDCRHLITTKYCIACRTREYAR